MNPNLSRANDSGDADDWAAPGRATTGGERSSRIVAETALGEGVSATPANGGSWHANANVAPARCRRTPREGDFVSEAGIDGY